MKFRKFSIHNLSFCLTILFSFEAAIAQNTSVVITDNRYYPSTLSMKDIRNAVGQSIQNVFTLSEEGAASIKTLGGRFLKGNISQSDIQALRSEGYFVEEDRSIFNAASPFIPNDPYFSQQWHLNNTGQVSGTTIDVDAPEAWEINLGSSAIVTVVLDAGIIYSNGSGAPTEMTDNMWVNPNEIAANGIDDDQNGVIDDIHGYDAVDDDGTPRPGSNSSHGMRVALTLAGKGNNSISGTGGLINASIMSVRVLSAHADYSLVTQGTLSQILAGIYYIIEMKERGTNIKIVNVSFISTSGSNPSLYTAISDLNDSQILVVAAAGNSGTYGAGYPAGFDLPNIISVAAVNGAGDLATRATNSFFSSNYGHMVDIAAPGSNVIYTTSGCFGTSCSAALVSAAAGLVYSENPTFTPQQVKARLLASTTPYKPYIWGSGQVDPFNSGTGIVNFCALDSNVCQHRVNFCNGDVGGDVNRDGEVDAADIDLVTLCFGQTKTSSWWSNGNAWFVQGECHAADLDASGEVDAADIDRVIATFGCLT